MEKEISEVLNTIKNETTNRNLERLEKTHEMSSKASAIFNLKDNVIGMKKEKEGPTAVLNPETYKLTFEPKEI